MLAERFILKNFYEQRFRLDYRRKASHLCLLCSEGCNAPGLTLLLLTPGGIKPFLLRREGAERKSVYSDHFVVVQATSRIRVKVDLEMLVL
jgi:hypothetical protein